MKAERNFFIVAASYLHLEHQIIRKTSLSTEKIMKFEFNHLRIS